MTMTSTTLERRDGVFSDPELRTLAGFLGGYSGLTRDAYSLDLRQFVQWAQTRHVALFDVARADIEGFARYLEDLGRARATISRRLCTITFFYRYAVEEGLLDRSPAVHSAPGRLSARCAYLILEVGDALLRSVGEVSVGLLKMRLPIGSAGLA